MQPAFSQYRRKEIDFPPNETETNKYRGVRSCVVVARCQPYMIKYTLCAFFHSFLIPPFCYNRDCTRRNLFRSSLVTRAPAAPHRATTEESPGGSREKICLLSRAGSPLPPFTLVALALVRKQYATTVIWNICGRTSRRNNTSPRSSKETCRAWTLKNPLVVS